MNNLGRDGDVCTSPEILLWSTAQSLRSIVANSPIVTGRVGPLNVKWVNVINFKVWKKRVVHLLPGWCTGNRWLPLAVEVARWTFVTQLWASSNETLNPPQSVNTYERAKLLRSTWPREPPKMCEINLLKQSWTGSCLTLLLAHRRNSK